MRICLVYDCLFPYTVGGGERWYRHLALRLAADGHEVTYVTLRQWERGERPDLPGVRVVAAGPRMALYSGPGQRRMAPPLVFGAGVLWHLLRHGRRYDVVHTSSFPYFSLLAAALVRRLGGYRLVVDWFELWSREYWTAYVGRAAGAVGWRVQRLCLRPRQQAFAFARLTARRLREEGLRSQPGLLTGLYAGPLTARTPVAAEPHVVFAGRHIPEKQAPAVVEAVALARRRIPQLRATIFGDGPERPRVLQAIRAGGLEGVVEAPGFVDEATLDEALARALCLLHPSRREGYGIVVVDSAALGVPTIVVDHPDNAAVELIEDGVNGVVAASASASALADAIVRVWEAGPAMRAATGAWFTANAPRLSIEASLDAVAAAYAA